MPLLRLSDIFCVQRHKKDFLNLVKNKLDIVFANEQEMQALVDEKELTKIINFSRSLKKIVVITRGKDGSIVINNDEVVECQSVKNLDVKDLTGAGDLFAAGFLHGLVNKLSLKESLNKGTELSSKVIQILGARL